MESLLLVIIILLLIWIEFNVGVMLDQILAILKEDKEKDSERSI